MIRWWKERHKRRLEERYRKGYDFAAGMLLRCERPDAEDYLLRHVENSRHFGVYDEFDSGVEDAVAKFQALLPDFTFTLD